MVIDKPSVNQTRPDRLTVTLVAPIKTEAMHEVEKHLEIEFSVKSTAASGIVTN